MIRKMTGIALCLFGCSVVCLGIIVTSFSDIDTYLKRGNNIVIAKAFSIPTNAPVNLGDGLHLVEVEIVRTLKGTNQPGRQIIATIYPLNSGRDYLLYRSEEHTSELQSRLHLVCRLLLEKKKQT